MWRNSGKNSLKQVKKVIRQSFFCSFHKQLNLDLSCQTFILCLDPKPGNLELWVFMVQYPIRLESMLVNRQCKFRWKFAWNVQKIFQTQESVPDGAHWWKKENKKKAVNTFFSLRNHCIIESSSVSASDLHSCTLDPDSHLFSLDPDPHSYFFLVHIEFN